ncbi:MAG: tRNA pseudouridine(38-40) synthase TruA [Chlamydiae bacterium RIFCSPHIGHO2_12_FULL_44_59]|nr:MAG: tRNA pseudouridine(38-40) synthase TruA [Chlamydiae bacterium RIFCSPHIGHO2_01_FULL_44_39]OGN58833.1 MAG: tRNA pseudouridine(38-40) synthase TruA [Chlamydiae bacterium RIFCSPHIGHO2_02_FULL_45_9]OGN60274.1 MAG: tRNA pseudouridine(38-40) synthase TruA [Chlamydiae bacterium RIFCSPHIGHO2_12_FULL_44_59]OGN67073.1 MAG: tRNA pseudouridine(38-40) synthase TruA [Chlamydiae bacterium RIFCSPLOWO2_01_FULL_44_52]OGN67663.1 MAG: tRNA pseudouridine(38-40) synthase TruA [Chlamydiae bacterium RIFCSPLOWO2
MPRYKIILSYDGTEYCGWQVQRNGISIQAVMQKALQTVLRHPVELTGSGRTDAGVHARGQVAHFDSNASFDTATLRFHLNCLLPSDIRVKKIEPAEGGFHARYSTKRKIYYYYLFTHPVMNPFRKLYSYHIRGPFNEKLLQTASQHFVGTHNFTSFANVKPNAPEDQIRTIFRIDIRTSEDLLLLEFEGDGFLYKMVRNITGTLIDIATGKIALEDLPTIFAAKDRRYAGRTAPAQGLFLETVIYTICEK